MKENVVKKMDLSKHEYFLSVHISILNYLIYVHSEKIKNDFLGQISIYTHQFS